MKRSQLVEGYGIPLARVLAGANRRNAFNRLQRCYERREPVIDAYFDLADTIITIRSLIRQAWTIYRWDNRPTRRPLKITYLRRL